MPYRTPQPPISPVPAARDDSATVAYVVLAVAGAVQIAVAPTLAQTLAGALACAGGLLLLAHGGGSRSR
jgi:hypothetical protein